MIKPALTDKEAKEALASVGIPRRYQGKSCTVDVLGEPTKIKEWMTQVATYQRGRVGINSLGVEEDIPSLFLLGSGGVEASYLIARGLLLSGVSVAIVVTPDLFNWKYRTSEKFRSRVKDALVVVLLGYNEAGVSLLGDQEQTYAVQWLIRRLIEDGKLFIFQGSIAPKNDETWGFTLARKVRGSSTVIQEGDLA